VKCGSETWVLTAKDRRRLEAAQMRFLRSVCGVTLRGKIKSETIRTQLREDNTVAEIRYYEEKWRQRVMRVTTNNFHDVPLPIGRWESDTCHDQQ
jgi:hypothetical protein